MRSYALKLSGKVLTVHPRSMRRCLPVVAMSALAVVLVLGGISGWGGEGLLCLLPGMLLACALCARRYPGERALLRCVTRRNSGRRLAQPARLAAGPARTRVPRGGLLIGFALAVRPPPAALPTS
jgi:hypothetical protein